MRIAQPSSQCATLRLTLNFPTKSGQSSGKQIGRLVVLGRLRLARSGLTNKGEVRSTHSPLFSLIHSVVAFTVQSEATAEKNERPVRCSGAQGLTVAGMSRATVLGTVPHGTEAGDKRPANLVRRT